MLCLQGQEPGTQSATRPTLPSQAVYSASRHSCTPLGCMPHLPGLQAHRGASSPSSTAFWWRLSLPWPFDTAAPSLASLQLLPFSAQLDSRSSPRGSAGTCVLRYPRRIPLPPPRIMVHYLRSINCSAQMVVPFYCTQHGMMYWQGINKVDCMVISHKGPQTL